MKVFVITKEFPPHVLGGMGVVAHEHARRLATRSGLQVTVIAPGAGRQPRWQRRGRLTVLRLPARRPYLRAGCLMPRAILRLLRRQGAPPPDVLYVHSPDALQLVKRLARGGQPPVVYMCHSLVVDELGGGTSPRRRRQEALLDLASRIVVPGPYAERALLKRYPQHARKVRVIVHGVRHPRRPGSASARRRLRLLFVGRLSRLKGIETLLIALAKVARRHPRVHLDIVGRGSTRMRRRLRRLIRHLGLGRRVRFCGYESQRRLERRYRRVGAVIVPSRQEFLGLVALEALAHGAPLVVTTAGGLDHIPKAAAFKVPPQHPRRLARAILTVIERPRLAAQRARWGQHWAQRFDWERSTDELLSVLYEAAARGEG